MFVGPLGGMMAATGVISALYETQPDGKGCQVDVSLADSATWLLSGNSSELAGAHQAIPFSPRRRLYLCGDGRYITVAADEPRRGPRYAPRWNSPSLPRTSVRRGRSPRNDRPAFGDLRHRSRRRVGGATWVHSARPWGVVNRGAEVVSDPHNVERGTTVVVRRSTSASEPIRLRDTAVRDLAPQRPSRP